MEHNLEDSLNLDSAMGVEFGHSEEVVQQADIGLEGDQEVIPMEFEEVVEQPLLMDTGPEEIIVSDFVSDQFSMPSYQDDQMISGQTDQSNFQQSLMLDHSGEMVNLQLDSSSISVAAPEIVPAAGRVITVEASNSQHHQSEHSNIAAVPRLIGIAPKPPQPKQSMLIQSGPGGKQFTIAPKPVTIMSNNKSISLVKKVSLTGAMQANAKGKPVLAQIGKQLVMMPASGNQKIKLVTSPSVRLIGADQKLMAVGQKASQAPKTITKVIVQGSKVKTQTVESIAKVSAGNASSTRFVTMHQKTVPIGKIMMQSPTKQGPGAARQQVLPIRSPTKLVAVKQNVQGPKTVVLNNQVKPGQSIVQVTSQPKTIKVQPGPGQKTQLHRIEVPGKGVQYIRLVTSSPASGGAGAGAGKPVKVHSTTSVANTPKSFVLTDAKGNVIQMSDTTSQGQPPPLVFSSSAINQVASKPQQKLVRIAPIASKAGQAAMQQQVRSSKSLLMDNQHSNTNTGHTCPPNPPNPPRPPQRPATSECNTRVAGSVKPPDMPDLGGFHESHEYTDENQEPDSKAALQALIAETIRGANNTEVEIDWQTTDQDTSYHQAEKSVEVEVNVTHDSSVSKEDDEHPLIVIPSFMKHITEDDYPPMGRDTGTGMNVEVEFEPYSPRSASPGYSNPDLPNEFTLRPRKACNCTKSQCLKLYCDCFANGEFCNQCNCHNCNNNLQNEELRQKAIRGCLDRNPYAFRPKIGKSKIGGPEIIRRHNKGCNCKRSGCLKNYCECFEAKIACTAMCKCVGCRNVEESVDRRRIEAVRRGPDAHAHAHAHTPNKRAPLMPLKQPCSFMTTEVIEAVCQCLIAAGVETHNTSNSGLDTEPDPIGSVLEEFARCMQDIIGASHGAA